MKVVRFTVVAVLKPRTQKRIANMPPNNGNKWNNMIGQRKLKKKISTCHRKWHNYL